MPITVLPDSVSAPFAPNNMNSHNKMKHIALYIGIAAAAVASCTPTPLQDEANFQASFEKPATSKEDDILLRWTADDRISLFNKTTDNQEFVFTGETGDATGEFRQVDNGGTPTGGAIPYVIAVYPYQAGTYFFECLKESVL